MAFPPHHDLLLTTRTRTILVHPGILQTVLCLPLSPSTGSDESIVIDQPTASASLFFR
jgi:hypothetical protein